ncbi:MAG TPA: serine/threonine-protein kinase [Polyangia bacterium]|nr:serine/threonine-protein kinase [Polyangia bacterium]
MSAEPRLPPPDEPGEETGLAKGATIGRYVVLGLLGRGGMGEVYAAYDPELDRKIAVKLLRARGTTAGADGRTRLLREAQAIARLSHPNVVVVFDVGTFRDSVFIAMEFVEGSTLGYWIQAQTRRWREVLDVYAAAGRGLVAAHAAGLVHRDFKPENVMITRSGQVRVMDFGLAREQFATDDDPAPAPPIAALAQLMDGDVDADATAKLGGGPGAAIPSPTSSSGGYLKLKLTQTGAMLGTPAYMAPEQFAGTGGDARTDQFSFCVALYEGLYGTRPFAGTNVVEVMANVVAGTVSDAPADARVPGWIRKILLRGLSTDPDHRYPTMTELLAALAQDPASRRRRWLAAAAGLALLAAAATGARRVTAGQHAMCAGGPERAATAWGRDRRAAIERAFNAVGGPNAARAFAGVATTIDSYLARWIDMYRETCEATHVRGEQSAEVLDLRMGCLSERLDGVRALGDVLMSADRAVVENAVSAAGALPGLDRCADVDMLRAVVKPPDDPAARAKVAAVREQIAKVRAVGDSGKCQDAARLGIQVARDATATGYLPVEAEAKFEAGRLGEACIEATTSIEFLQRAAVAAEASRHDEVFVESTAVLAEMLADRQHEISRAEDAIGHCRAVLSRLSGHPVLEAWVASAAATVALNEGNYAEALQFDQRAYELRQRLYGPDNAEVSTALTNWALALHALRRDAEAEPLNARAIDIETRVFGSDNSRSAMLQVNHAEILTALGRFPEAHAAVQAALSIWRRQGADQSLVGYGLLDLGRLQLAEGNAAVAARTLEESLRLVGDADRDTTAEVKFALARALWFGPRSARARAIDLAHAARELLGNQPGAKRVLDEIEAWESSHRPA